GHGGGQGKSAAQGGTCSEHALLPLRLRAPFARSRSGSANIRTAGAGRLFLPPPGPFSAPILVPPPPPAMLAAPPSEEAPSVAPCAAPSVGAPGRPDVLFALVGDVRGS